MKKTVLFTLMCFILTTALFAQPKSQRRIYLWDVTLSMKGYQGKTPDIYDDVVKFLEQEINSITDENTEIVVCPFQEKILATWKVKADKSGKKEIIRQIKTYNNNDVTNTNIVKPIQDIQANIIADDKRNLLVLLTDGKHSEKFGGSGELLRLIKGWGEYADKNYAYALYVVLTQEGLPDREIVNAIEQEKNIMLIEPDKLVEMIDLQPSELIKINIKDDKTAQIPLTYRQSVKLPDGIKMQITAEDSVLNINQIVNIKDGKIVFDVKYKKPYNTLKTELAETTRLPLHIKLVNKEDIEKTEGKIVYLTKEELQLELINRPEKTLKISIKK